MVAHLSGLLPTCSTSQPWLSYNNLLKQPEIAPPSILNYIYTPVKTLLSEIKQNVQRLDLENDAKRKLGHVRNRATRSPSWQLWEERQIQNPTMTLQFKDGAL